VTLYSLNYGIFITPLSKSGFFIFTKFELLKRKTKIKRKQFMEGPRETHIRNFNVYTKIISIILLISFIWQNAVWANPDFANPKTNSSTLQIRTLFTNKASQHRIVGRFLALLEDEILPSFPGDGRGMLEGLCDLLEQHEIPGYTVTKYPQDSPLCTRADLSFPEGTIVSLYDPNIHTSPPYGEIYPVQELRRYLHKQVVAKEESGAPKRKPADMSKRKPDREREPEEPPSEKLDINEKGLLLCGGKGTFEAIETALSDGIASPHTAPFPMQVMSHHLIERLGINALFQGKLLLSMVGNFADKAYKRTTAAIHYGKWGDVSFIVDPKFVEKNPHLFTASGKLFDTTRPGTYFRSGDRKRSIYNNLRYVPDERAYPDSVFTRGLPKEAIIGMVIHSTEWAEFTRYQKEKYSSEKLLADVIALISTRFSDREFSIFDENGNVLYEQCGKEPDSDSALNLSNIGYALIAGALILAEKYLSGIIDFTPQVFLIIAAIYATSFLIHYFGHSAETRFKNVIPRFSWEKKRFYLPDSHGLSGVLSSFILGSLFSLVLLYVAPEYASLSFIVNIIFALSKSDIQDIAYSLRNYYRELSFSRFWEKADSMAKINYLTQMAQIGEAPAAKAVLPEVADIADNETEDIAVRAVARKTYKDTRIHAGIRPLECEFRRVDTGDYYEFHITLIPNTTLNGVEAEMRYSLGRFDEFLIANGINKTRNVIKQKVFIRARNNEDFNAKKSECETLIDEFYGRNKNPERPRPTTSYIAEEPDNYMDTSLECVVIVPKLDKARMGIENKRFRAVYNRDTREITVLKPREHYTLQENEAYYEIDYALIRESGLEWLHVEGITAGEEGQNDIELESDIAFRLFEALLHSEGMEFSDVVRQWNYLERITDLIEEDEESAPPLFSMLGIKHYTKKVFQFLKIIKIKILQRYQIFNNIRGFYYDKKKHLWINGNPAATGIGTYAGGVVLGGIALKTRRKDVRIVPIINPLQISAHKYKGRVLIGKVASAPRFERAKAVIWNGIVRIFVSGTASIREQKTVEVGNALNQTKVTIENIEVLISRRNLEDHNIKAGATLDDVSEVTAYVKYTRDVPAVLEECKKRFKNAAPNVVVADICRPNLLVEIECIATTKEDKPKDREVAKDQREGAPQMVGAARGKLSAKHAYGKASIENPLPPIGKLEARTISSIRGDDVKTLYVLVDKCEDMSEAVINQHINHIFTGDLPETKKLRDTFHYMIGLARKQKKFKTLLLNALLSTPVGPIEKEIKTSSNFRVNSLVFAVSDKLPIDSARYYIRDRDQAVIVFNTRFFNLDELIPESDVDSREAAMHVRSERTLHELRHDNMLGDIIDEADEETHIIDTQTIPLWEVTCDIGMQKKIDEMRKIDGIKEAMHHSGDFFSMIPDWLAATILRACKIIHYVRGRLSMLENLGRLEGKGHILPTLVANKLLPVPLHIMNQVDRLNTIGRRLAFLRKYHGLSQEELESISGVSKSAIRKIEGDRLLRRSQNATLEKLAMTLGVTAEDLNPKDKAEIPEKALDRIRSLNTLGERILSLCEIREWSLSLLARKSGISKAQLWVIVKNKGRWKVKTKVRESTIEKLARTLRVDIGVLRPGKNEFRNITKIEKRRIWNIYTLGERIRFVRKTLRELTIRELAEIATVDKSQLIKIENDKVTPRSSTLFKLAYALKIDPAFFVVKTKPEELRMLLMKAWDIPTLQGRLMYLRETCKKITMTELAKRANLSLSTVKNIESGVVRHPTSKTLKKLAVALSVPEDMLFLDRPAKILNGIRETLEVSTIGVLIETALGIRNWGIIRLARRSGVSEATIKKFLEKRIKRPYFVYVVKIATALRIHLAYFPEKLYLRNAVTSQFGERDPRKLFKKGSKNLISVRAAVMKSVLDNAHSTVDAEELYHVLKKLGDRSLSCVDEVCGIIRSKKELRTHLNLDMAQDEVRGISVGVASETALLLVQAENAFKNRSYVIAEYLFERARKSAKAAKQHDESASLMEKDAKEGKKKSQKAIREFTEITIMEMDNAKERLFLLLAQKLNIIERQWGEDRKETPTNADYAKIEKELINYLEDIIEMAFSHFLPLELVNYEEKITEIKGSLAWHIMSYIYDFKSRFIENGDKSDAWAPEVNLRARPTSKVHGKGSPWRETSDGFKFVDGGSEEGKPQRWQETKQRHRTIHEVLGLGEAGKKEKELAKLAEKDDLDDVLNFLLDTMKPDEVWDLTLEEFHTRLESHIKRTFSLEKLVRILEKISNGCDFCTFLSTGKGKKKKYFVKVEGHLLAAWHKAIFPKKKNEEKSAYAKAETPLPPLHTLKARSIVTISGNDVKSLCHLVEGIERSNKGHVRIELGKIFRSNTPEREKLKETFFYMIMLAKRSGRFKKLLLEALRSPPYSDYEKAEKASSNLSLNALTFALSERLGLDSAQYFDEQRNHATIVFGTAFFNLDDHIPETDEDSLEAALHVRMERTIHELRHDNYTNDWGVEAKEEASIIDEQAVPLWEITVEIGMQDKIQRMREYRPVRRVMGHSGDFFGRLEQWSQMDPRKPAIKSYAKQRIRALMEENSTRGKGFPKKGQSGTGNTPDRDVLRKTAEADWTRKLKEGNRSNLDFELLQRALGIDLSENLGRFDIYRDICSLCDEIDNMGIVPDNLLNGRRFWFDEDTFSLYFGEGTLREMTLDEFLDILREIHDALESLDIERIRVLEGPGETIEPELSPEGEPADTAGSEDGGKELEAQAAEEEASTPSGEGEKLGKIGEAETTASEKPPETHTAIRLEAPKGDRKVPSGIKTPALDEPKEPSRTHTLTPKPPPKRSNAVLRGRIHRAARSAFSGEDLPNMSKMEGTNLDGTVLRITSDVTGSSDERFSPGLRFFQLLPMDAVRLRPSALIIDPHVLNPASQVHKDGRYEASFNVSDMVGALRQRFPGIARVKNAFDPDPVRRVLEGSREGKRAWLEKGFEDLATIFERKRRDLESARDNHPREVEAVSETVKYLYDRHKNLRLKIMEALSYLQSKAHEGKVPHDAVMEGLRIIDEALETWPRAQAAIRQTRNSITDDIDTVELGPILDNLKVELPSFAKSLDNWIILRRHPDVHPAILAQIYYDVFREVWDAETCRIRTQFEAGVKDEELNFIINEVAVLGRWLLRLEWDAASTKLTKKNILPYNPDNNTNYPAGGAGVLFLNQDNSPREFVEGGGAVSLPLAHGVRYYPNNLREWYGENDKIVLVYPSETGFPSLEALHSFFEDFGLLSEFIPGSPEVLLGIMDKSGNLRIYQTNEKGGKNPYDPEGTWFKATGYLFSVLSVHRELQSYFTANIFSPPSVRSQAGMEFRGRNFRSMDETYLWTEKIVKDFEGIVYECCRRTFGIPYTEALMKAVNAKYGSEIKDLKRNVDRIGSMESLEVFHRRLSALTQRVHILIAEHLGAEAVKHLVEEEGLLRQIEIEDLSLLAKPKPLPLRSEFVQSDDDKPEEESEPKPNEGTPQAHPKAYLIGLRADSRAAMACKALPNQITMRYTDATDTNLLVQVDTTGSKKPHFSVSYLSQWISQNTPLLIPVIPNPRMMGLAGGRYNAELSKLNCFTDLKTNNPYYVRILEAKIQNPWKTGSPEEKMSLLRDLCIVTQKALEHKYKGPTELNSITDTLGRKIPGLSDSIKEAADYCIALLKDEFKAGSGIEKIFATLGTYEQDGKVPARRAKAAINEAIALLQRWPRIILSLEDYRDDDIEKSQTVDMTELKNMFNASRQGIRQQRHFILSEHPSAENGAMELIYYDAVRYFLLRYLLDSENGLLKQVGDQKEPDEPTANTLLDCVCHVHSEASQMLHEEHITKMIEEMAKEAVSPGDPSPQPISGIGTLFMRESQPGTNNRYVRRQIRGGGAIMPPGKHASTYFSTHIKEWHEEGDTIVLLYSVNTESPNPEQLRIYCEDWYHFAKSLPGNPRVLLGTVSVLDGSVHLYRPNAEVGDDNAWYNITARVSHVNEQYKKFRNHVMTKTIRFFVKGVVELSRKSSRKTSQLQQGIAYRKFMSEVNHRIRNYQNILLEGLMLAGYSRTDATAIVKCVKSNMKDLFNDLTTIDTGDYEEVERRFPHIIQRTIMAVGEIMSTSLTSDAELFEPVVIEGFSSAPGAGVTDESTLLGELAKDATRQGLGTADEVYAFLAAARENETIVRRMRPGATKKKTAKRRTGRKPASNGAQAIRPIDFQTAFKHWQKRMAKAAEEAAARFEEVDIQNREAVSAALAQMSEMLEAIQDSAKPILRRRFAEVVGRPFIENTIGEIRRRYEAFLQGEAITSDECQELYASFNLAKEMATNIEELSEFRGALKEAEKEFSILDIRAGISSMLDMVFEGAVGVEEIRVFLEEGRELASQNGDTELIRKRLNEAESNFKRELVGRVTEALREDCRKVCKKAQRGDLEEITATFAWLVSLLAALEVMLDMEIEEDVLSPDERRRMQKELLRFQVAVETLALQKKGKEIEEKDDPDPYKKEQEVVLRKGQTLRLKNRHTGRCIEIKFKGTEGTDRDERVLLEAEPPIGVFPIGGNELAKGFLRNEKREGHKGDWRLGEFYRRTREESRQIDGNLRTIRTYSARIRHFPARLHVANLLGLLNISVFETALGKEKEAPQVVVGPEKRVNGKLKFEHILAALFVAPTSLRDRGNEISLMISDDLDQYEEPEVIQPGQTSANATRSTDMAGRFNRGSFARSNGRALRRRKDQVDKYSAPTDEGDDTNPFIREHIDNGVAIEVDEWNEKVKIIRMGPANPRDPPLERYLERLFRANGTFKRIREAKDPSLFKEIMDECYNFQKYPREDRKKLIEIAMKTRLSFILGEVLIGKVETDEIYDETGVTTAYPKYSHCRTGFSRDVHGLDPTIWAGEVLFNSRLKTQRERAQYIIEEAQHILHPPRQNRQGKWIWVDFNPEENPDHLKAVMIEHYEPFMSFLWEISEPYPTAKERATLRAYQSATIEQVESGKTYTGTKEFAREHEVGFLVKRSVKSILEREIPNCAFATRRISDVRSWMDEKGQANTPLIIWENISLGPYYVHEEYLRELEGRDSVCVIGEDQIEELVSERIKGSQSASIQNLAETVKGARYVIVRAKMPSANHNSKRDPALVRLMQDLSKSFSAPIVMVDHSLGNSSPSHDYVGNMYEPDQVAVCNINTQRSFRAMEFPKGGILLIALNANKNITRPGKEGLTSSFDDVKLFCDPGYSLIVTIGGVRHEVYDIVMKLYWHNALTALRTLDRARRGSLERPPTDMSSPVPDGEKPHMINFYTGEGRTPESLFPIHTEEERTRIATLLGKRPDELDLRVEVHSFKHDEIRIDLYDGETRLTRLSMCVRNKLTLTRVNPVLPFAKVLARSDSYYTENPMAEADVIGDEQVYIARRTYHRLRDYVMIDNFELNYKLRQKGLGKLWYKKYLEPYLKNCGFDVLSLMGTCLDFHEDPETREFWVKRGFEGFHPLNHLYNAETTLRYFAVKVLEGNHITPFTGEIPGDWIPPRGSRSTNMSLRVRDEEKLFETAEDVERNLAQIVPRLVNALMVWARNTETDNEEIALLLDMPPLQSQKIKEIINDFVIKPLKVINENNDDMIEILERLTVYDRDDIRNVRRKIFVTGKLKEENLVIVTNEAGLTKFSDFENASITALGFTEDDFLGDFDEDSYYYPYVETVFFAVLRKMGCKEEALWYWYQRIPNIDVSNMTEEALRSVCFDAEGNPRTTVVIRLLRRAGPFNHNTIEEIYARIEEFIRKA